MITHLRISLSGRHGDTGRAAAVHTRLLIAQHGNVSFSVGLVRKSLASRELGGAVSPLERGGGALVAASCASLGLGRGLLSRRLRTAPLLKPPQKEPHRWGHTALGGVKGARQGLLCHRAVWL